MKILEKVKILSPEIKRYLIIGASVYALEVVVIIVAQYFGASPVLAVSLGFWLGLVTSFFLQKIVTFSDKRMHHKILIPQVIAFSLLVLFNFGFTVLVTKLLSPPMPAVAARTLALIATTLWNFYLYKTRIFKVDNNILY